MRSLVQRRIAAPLVAGVFVLAGCGGNLTDSLAAPASTSASSLSRAGSPAQLQVLGKTFALESPAKLVSNHRGSWMARGAASATLLYVADEATGDVDVYSYPKGQRVGTLTGFNTPSGLCSDKTGDVYVLNGGGFTIDVFAHGGTSPIRTLSLPGYPELNCSVNPRTGDLALGTFDGSCAECAAFIAIFPGGQGLPTTYQPSGQIGIPGCGYDNAGNLYCDAYSKIGRKFLLFELPKKSTTVETIAVSGTLPKAGPVQWDGQNLAVGSGASSTIDQIAVTGSSGSVVGSTTLYGAGWVWQFWITKRGTRIVVPTYAGTSAAEVGYWGYPAGGSATKAITGFYQPDGATLSR